jgi:hypothetical protein
MTFVVVALLSLGVASMSLAQEGAAGGQPEAAHGKAEKKQTKKHGKKKHKKSKKKEGEAEGSMK